VRCGDRGAEHASGECDDERDGRWRDDIDPDANNIVVANQADFCTYRPGLLARPTLLEQAPIFPLLP